MDKILSSDLVAIYKPAKATTECYSRELEGTPIYSMTLTVHITSRD